MRAQNATQAETDAARKLVNGFDSIPKEWVRLVAEHIDGDEYVAMPMWGTLFSVNADTRNISKLLTDIEPPYELIEEAKEAIREENDGDDDAFDSDDVLERAIELWEDQNSEDYELRLSGWQSVGNTGIIAREFDGHLMLGINGMGYDFYEAHWIPLYRELGYRWHE